MQLDDLSKYLLDRFTLDSPHYLLDEIVECHTFEFTSDISYNFDDKNELFNLNLDGTNLESGDKENQKFRYAIFSPAQNRKFSEAIIMFHGLNERSWNKYLPWAYNLVLQTDKPVILFPIAYHINRAPLNWICPRQMSKFSLFRKEAIPEVQNSSFVNVAISLRMDNYPELFALSGVQTYFDVVKLVSSIKSGNYELFEKDCKIDFFGYSIGALLSETLLISNPLGLFSESKAFLFCGGATFDKINANSRAIMDNIAFANLRNYLLNNKIKIKKNIKIPKQQKFLFKKAWKSFMAMVGIKKYGNYRKSELKRLIHRIKAVGLVNDYIVPGNAIKETLGKVLKHKSFDVDILDFPYKYSHEIPFPLNNKKINNIVNNSFSLVFNKAGFFLNK